MNSPNIPDLDASGYEDAALPPVHDAAIDAYRADGASHPCLTGAGVPCVDASVDAADASEGGADAAQEAGADAALDSGADAADAEVPLCYSCPTGTYVPCPGGDAAYGEIPCVVDAASDAPADSPVDAPFDSPIDAPVDAGTDAAEAGAVLCYSCPAGTYVPCPGNDAAAGPIPCAPDASADAPVDATLGDAQSGDAGADAPCEIVSVFGYHYVTSTGHVFTTASVGVATPIALPAADGGPGGPTLAGVVSGMQGGIGAPGWGCALLADTSVWCWYTGSSAPVLGELGLGDAAILPPGPNVAAQVVTMGDGGFVPLTGVKRLMNDSYNTYGRPVCVVMEDTTIRCWGELNGTGGVVAGIPNSVPDPNSSASVPFAVPILAGPDGGLFTHASQVVVGQDHACALTSATAGANDGLWCWGYAQYDPLGAPMSDAGTTLANEVYPTQVTRVPETQFEYVTAGAGNTCVLASSDGGPSRIYCFGVSDRGQTGTGVLTGTGDPCRGNNGAGNSCEDRSPARPVAIGPADGGIAYDAATPLTGMTAIYTGDFFSCASDGAFGLWCWGQDSTSNSGTPYAILATPPGGASTITPYGSGPFTTQSYRYLTDAGTYLEQGATTLSGVCE